MDYIKKLWEIVYAINRALPWDTDEMSDENNVKLFEARNKVCEVLESLGEEV
jgi:hypothetical protein